MFTLAGSSASKPAMTPSSSAVSSTVLQRTDVVKGPRQRDHAAIAGPAVGRLDPTRPQHDAGIRTDPAVSRISDPKHRFAAVAAAEPPDDPPGMRSRAHGFRTGPK